uniref:Uncharacterized protein n=1 Tax=Anopheles coluzzii TaxID=1518534 RepID=A0A8W7PE10_ANOCL
MQFVHHKSGELSGVLRYDMFAHRCRVRLCRASDSRRYGTARDNGVRTNERMERSSSYWGFELVWSKLLVLVVLVLLLLLLPQQQQQQSRACLNAVLWLRLLTVERILEAIISLQAGAVSLCCVKEWQEPKIK